MINKSPSAHLGDVKNAPIETLYSKFATSAQGLSTKEAASRLQRYGYNEIPEKRVNLIKKLLGYFGGPIAWMIEAVYDKSLTIGHFV